MKNALPSNFSMISIIKAIHKATYYDYESSQSEKNNLDFLNLLDKDYSFLISKKKIQKAFVYGLCKTVELERRSTLLFLKNSTMYELLPKSRKIEFLCYALSFDHQHYKLIVDLFESDFKLAANNRVNKILHTIQSQSFN